jgi:ArsR family transcriptional regulator
MAKALTMATQQISACCDGALGSVLPRTDADEACVCDLTVAVQLSQPTVSHHLKVLTDAGLLTRERRGTWAWFTLVPSRLADIASIFT